MTASGLYRSTQKNMIAGVMGGVAERFGWNANFLRLACRVNFFSYLCAPAMCGKGLQQVKFKRKTQWIH